MLYVLVTNTAVTIRIHTLGIHIHYHHQAIRGGNMATGQLTGYPTNVIQGTSGNDRLNGSRRDETILGLGGNDTLRGGGGNDVLIGGPGDDLYIVDGSDTVMEDPDAGNDTVIASVSWTLGEAIENLTLAGATAIDGTGNALDNTLRGNRANNVLRGEAGNDVILGGAGDDLLFGGDGDDVLNGGPGNDFLTGGSGNDVYIVDSIGDITSEAAAGGKDWVQSSISWTLSEEVEDLTLVGSAAIDGTGNALDNSITGNAAANLLWGGDGDDILTGEDGADQLLGEAGDDTLNGGDGNDTLTGGTGQDQLTGGDGQDRFLLTSRRRQDADTIVDFDAKDDTIGISLLAFELDGQAGKPLDPSLFRLGTRAATATDRFIYNRNTGALLFDADGAGGSAQVQIAQLANQAQLSSSQLVWVA
ncbi:MAG: calcium-binding protein [Synechococcales cyanobacterium M58_A2018_015]|nr:calcium-binding protein [Synechococcales cyanobacterium M58_A2018_015]